MNGDVIIDLKNIYKRFYIGEPNELEILHGIDLTVREGEFVSIVGASGSGKSTLMNIIGALDRPTEGSYDLNGTNVCAAPDSELSHIRNKQIGFVFQTYNLIPRNSEQRNFSAWSAWVREWITLPMNFQAVRNSVWQLQGLWQMILPLSSQTNPRALLILQQEE